MKRISILDTTLRDGEQTPGISLNLHEKLDIARQLARLEVDAIEAGFPIASEGDFESVKAIAQLVKGPCISGLCRASDKDILRAWDALRYSGRPMLHIFIATSDIHMQYKLKMTREQVLERIDKSIRLACSLCPTVQFSAEDASRSDMDFLQQAVAVALQAGANLINLPDTVGYSLPHEYGAMFSTLRERVSGLRDVPMAAHCHNDLGLAVANTLAAIEAGVTQVECTINGFGERAGNASLEEVVMALHTREKVLQVHTRIQKQQLYRTSAMVAHFFGLTLPPNKPIVGENAFKHESGIHQHGVMANALTYEILKPAEIGVNIDGNMVLGKHSGMHAFADRLQRLGFSLSEEELQLAFERFKQFADRKGVMMDQDIAALANDFVSPIPEQYELEYFHITSGNSTVATATVRIRTENRVIQEAACGDGPVDALFKTIERAVELKITLDDYFLRAVTGGQDALGEVITRITINDIISVGRGISTDVIEASARAYMNAINKYLYEHELGNNAPLQDSLTYTSDSED